MRFVGSVLMAGVAFSVAGGLYFATADFAHSSDTKKTAETGKSAPATRIESGRVSGTAVGEHRDVHVYKGIPFAAPPVGELRWKPPQPVQGWGGVRACTKFGPACPQPKLPIISADITETGEDCLYLNVWAPAKPAGSGAPVMVWIHGGAFIVGAGSQTWFNGEALARKGVVVVTINYRLGPFGFFAHPLLSRESERHVSGNYALLDQVAALRWVRKNIAAFGGDPDRVTIFGESAGGASVCHLLVSPLARGLFHRAIAESGGARAPIRHLREKWYGKESMEDVGTFVARSLGCDRADDPLAALRARSAAEILKAVDDAKRRFGEDVTAPVVDGWVQPDDPGLLFDEGKAHDVPFLVGSNADEVGGVVSDFLVRGHFGADADAVLKLFPGESRKRAATVSIFNSVARADARAMSRHRSKAYLYRFTRVAPAFRFLGSFHALEIVYVFGNLDPKLRFEPRDRELSDTMMGYWTGFARTGDPNGDGRPKWPAYDPEGDRHLELGDKVRSGSGLDRAACDGIDRLCAERTKKRKGS